MKIRLIFLFISLAFCSHNVFAQAKPRLNYYYAGAFADVSAEFVYLHYMRFGVQHYFNNRFSIQGSLKVGSRSMMRVYIPSQRDGIPINWINWHKDNPLGNPFIFEDTEVQPERLGISSYPIGDQSLFYSNIVLSSGWRVPIFFKGQLEFLAGAGLRYTDEHYIGEAGSAIFTHDSTEYQIYYLVPVYQRGIDAHLNFEMNVTFPITEKLYFRPGFLADFSFGWINIGVGNYYSVGASLVAKL